MGKISPIREWRCVLAVLILVAAFQPCAHAQQALKFSPKVLAVLNTPPLEIKNDEDPLVTVPLKSMAGLFERDGYLHAVGCRE